MSRCGLPYDERVTPVVNKPERLHDQTVHHLALRILRGEVLPGDALPNEAQLGAELGVSRTVVREAAKALAAKGLVEIRPKTGMRVRDRREWNLLDPHLLAWRYEMADGDEQALLDLCEVRAVIEPVAAELAARRASADDVARIQDAFEEMAATAGKDEDRFVAADLRFHGLILAASGNELLAQLASTLRVALRASRSVTMRTGSARGSLREHRDVMAAIRDRDHGAANAAMQRLIARAERDIRRALGPRRRARSIK